jgi:hypothetical protein
MKLLRKALRGEAGQALPITLILLVLGGLLIVPMLSLMTTNLNANIWTEEKTKGIYAADAGIQDALWKLGNDVDPFENGDSYNLEENGNPVTINGMTVTVDKMALDEEDMYTLRATARLDGDVKAVIIAQAISGSDFSWLFKHALNSLNDVELPNNNVTVYGGVMCGGEFSGDPDAVITGGITQNADVKMPSEATLTKLYRGQVNTQAEAPDGWYEDDPEHNNAWKGNINVTGGTADAPFEIGPRYCWGDVEITGSGYAELTGTLFIDGAFKMKDKGLTLDLNGQTIYATYYNDCSNNPAAVDFWPDIKLVGPGCVIGVGYVNFQPGYSQGMWLIGADPDDLWAQVEPTAPANTLVMTKFKTNKKLSSTDKMGSFQVKCYVADPDAEPKANVKVAIYKADGSGGGPGTRVRAIYASDNLTAAWNTIEISPAQALQANTYYWLAAISNQAVISTKPGFTQGTASRFIAADFSSFEFQDPFNLSSLQDPGSNEYQLRGFTGGQEFIFLMSLKCTTYLAPGANFYGSIAGNTLVQLHPNCFIDLVGMPDEALNFPGITGSSPGPGHGGNSPPLLNYNIQ